ncbi:MAG: sulfite exporter TauE/SafE family protein [Phycisphaerae bacterium]
MPALAMKLVAVLSGGFLASAHCIGMCGGFAATIGATRRELAPALARQLIYNAGRIFTYVFLGATLGAAGATLPKFTLLGLGPAQLFGLLAGLLMIGLGLAALGLLPLPHRVTALGCDVLAPLFAHFLDARGVWGYFAAGLANGFLPCGLVYSFLALAAAAADPLAGGLIMAAFGLGTLPAMLLAGLGSRLIGLAPRRAAIRAAAVVVVLMGGVTVWRAWPTGRACCDHPAAQP